MLFKYCVHTWRGTKNTVVIKPLLWRHPVMCCLSGYILSLCFPLFFFLCCPWFISLCLCLAGRGALDLFPAVQPAHLHLISSYNRYTRHQFSSGQIFCPWLLSSVCSSISNNSYSSLVHLPVTFLTQPPQFMLLIFLTILHLYAINHSGI